MSENTRVKTGSYFASPATDVEAERFKQAREVVRAALNHLLQEATAAGWGTQEITVALVDVASVLKDSHVADASPIEVPPMVQK